MTNLEIFQCTSSDPYLRHHYKLHFTGKKPIIFDNWDDAFNYWIRYSYIDKNLKYITVEDIGGGFKNK